MYSKPKQNQDEPFRIPENYRGNAFHEDSVTPSAPTEPLPMSELPITTLTADTIEDKAEAAPTNAPVSSTEESISVSKNHSPFSALLPPRLLGSHGGLLGEIGVEELLIIGILILLSQSETDDDILLLLMLLLFYK